MNDWNDMGEELRGTRVDSSQSLADISHRTRIPISTLAALEKNDYGHFASPAYAKSFLRQYSEYLGIDAHEWLESFDTGSVLDDLDSYEYLKPHAEKTDGAGSSAKERAKNRPNVLPILLFVLSVALISALFYGYVYVDKLIEKATADSNEDAPEAQEPPEQAVSSQKSSDPDTDPAPDDSPDRPMRPLSIPETDPAPRAIIVPEESEDQPGIEISENQ